MDMFRNSEGHEPGPKSSEDQVTKNKVITGQAVQLGIVKTRVPRKHKPFV